MAEKWCVEFMRDDKPALQEFELKGTAFAFAKRMVRKFPELSVTQYVSVTPRQATSKDLKQGRYHWRAFRRWDYFDGDVEIRDLAQPAEVRA